MTNLVFLIVGAILGGAVTWFAARLWQSSNKGFSQEEVEQKYVPRTQHDELRDMLNAREAELQAKYVPRTEYDELRNGQNTRETELRKEWNERELKLCNERDARESKLTVLTDDCATLREQNRSLNERIGENRKELDELQKKFQTEFENVANKIFDEKSKKFVDVNEDKMKGILNPLSEKIQEFKKLVTETYEKEMRDKLSLTGVINEMKEKNLQMSEDAKRLANALKNDKQTLGAWGEGELERLLEKACLERGIHFERQEVFKTDEGKIQRPDYVIKLPEGKNFVIDSKVTLNSYDAYYNAKSDAERVQELKKLVENLKKHINDLGSKKYQNLPGINAPDCVFLFVPIESALITALQHDRSLFDEALKQNILLVSTSTLLAAMRTVSFIWTQDKQKKNVEEVFKLAGLLYNQFVEFFGDLKKVGVSIEAAHTSYGNAMNKLGTSDTIGGGSIIGRVCRLKNMGAKATKAIPHEWLDKIEDDGEGAITLDIVQ